MGINPDRKSGMGPCRQPAKAGERVQPSERPADYPAISWQVSRGNFLPSILNDTSLNGALACEGYLCPPCSEEQFSCQNGVACVLRRDVCDGHFDCRDRSDEAPINRNCGPPTCTPKQFMCVCEQTCIPKWSLCDGHIDCQDGSDEHNCEPICEPGFFRCDNYRCIPSTFICDGKYDCGPHDKSDEKHCSTTAVPCLHLDYYQCLNGGCIPRHMTCDGHDDCGDQSDELDCYDCDGKLKVVDKLSPELKVDPVELKNVFQSSNHTVPVRVMPTTVITIQLLVRNFNIVSLHMFVGYIKEIQLVFLDANGTAIENATQMWKSKLMPGSDIAVMSATKKYRSNMVKVSLKPFRGSILKRRMLIKAITLRGCYELALDPQMTLHPMRETTTAKPPATTTTHEFTVTEIMIPKTSTTIKTWTELKKSTLGMTQHSEIISTTFPTSRFEIGSTTLPISHSSAESKTSEYFTTTEIPCPCETMPLDYGDDLMKRLDIYTKDEAGIELPESRQALFGSPDEYWSTKTIMGSKYFVTLTVVEPCSIAGRIAKIHVTVKGTHKTQVFAGTTELHSWDKLVPTSEISLVAAPCVLSNDLLLVIEASGGVLQLSNLVLDVCVCLAKETKMKPVETTVTSLDSTTTADNTEPTPKKPCSKSLPINYVTNEKLFEIIASSDAGTTYLNVSKVLRYSDGNGWSTEAMENQILTVNITLKDECSGNWEIDTVNFETSYTKEIKLENNKMIKYKWTFEEYAGMKKVTTIVKELVVGNTFLLVFKSARGRLLVADLNAELFCSCSEGGELPLTVYGDLTKGITHEITTGTVKWTQQTTETVTTPSKSTLHTTERVTGKFTLSKITSRLLEEATTITRSEDLTKGITHEVTTGTETITTSSKPTLHTTERVTSPGTHLQAPIGGTVAGCILGFLLLVALIIVIVLLVRVYVCNKPMPCRVTSARKTSRP